MQTTDSTPTLKERIEVALSLAAGMLDLDADQMDDEKAAHNCRGAARIVRENYDLLVSAPALGEQVAELEAALRPFADWWFAGVFVGPTDLHQQLGIAGMRAHQTLAAALDAGEAKE